MVFFPTAMKPHLSLILVFTVLTSVGCSEAKKETEKNQPDGAAKARADAAKKEMDTIPKVFRSRDIFEKNEPVKTQQNSTSTSAPKKT